MSKFDLFAEANSQSGVVEKVREVFGKYGEFHVDNADVINQVSKLENVTPALIAVTWLNETTFRFYSEPNKNNSTDFMRWDVGPMQLNRRVTTQDINVGFISPKGLDISAAFGSGVDLFVGSPIMNIRLSARKLKALGRAVLIGKDGVVLFPKVSLVEWSNLTEADKDLRRAVAYTGPDARNYRQKSFETFYPLFTKFFSIYK